MDAAAARAAVGAMAGEPGSLRLPSAMRPLVQLVLATMGQWRLAGGGLAAMQPVALDLVAVDVAARWLGITPDAGLLRDLQLIEHEALIAMRSER